MPRPLCCITFAVALLPLAVAADEALAQEKPETLFSSGNIRVSRSKRQVGDDTLVETILYRDSVHFGMSVDLPRWKNTPSTYYHADGPLGCVMRKWNVESGDSQPAMAVIGMNAGTVAAYARPKQRIDFYEESREIVALNDGKGKNSYFAFIPDARARGADVRIIHGSPRAQLRKQGAKTLYKIIVLEACSGEDGEKLFLDLLTKEGIAECLEHLTEDGILCIHTSHRFIELPPALAAIARSLGGFARRGHDSFERRNNKTVDDEIHFTSEWVMIARKKKTLDGACVTPENYQPPIWAPGEKFWSTPNPCPQVWNDKGPNSVKGLLRGHPFNMRYQAAVRPALEKFFKDASWRFSQFPLDRELAKVAMSRDIPLSELWQTPSRAMLDEAIFRAIVGDAFRRPRHHEVVFSSGILEVRKTKDFLAQANANEYQLLRDHILFGSCSEDAKLSGTANTYYHAEGPLGEVMEKFNVKTDNAEPSMAVLGMNAGTVAVYARAKQRIDFYEPSKEIIDLNEREENRFFTYVASARKRGADVRIFHGQPRQTLQKSGLKRFYKIMVIEACSGERGEKLFLDLFTKEGIAACLDHLTDDGILCVHISHRFVELERPLAAIAKALGASVRYGHDVDVRRDSSRSSSAWVVISRGKGVLDGLKRDYWKVPTPYEQVWTDKGPNSVRGVLRGHPFAMRYSAAMRPVADLAETLSEVIGVRRPGVDLTNLPEPINQMLVRRHTSYDWPLSQLWPE